MPDFFGKQGGKFPAAFVFVNDESLEMNPLFSGFDGGDPRRIVFSGVLEQLDSISRYQEGPSRTQESASSDKFITLPFVDTGACYLEQHH